MTSRRLQIFRFMLIEMFSPCFLNSRVMFFLVRSDCGPLAFLRSTSPSYLLTASFLPVGCVYVEDFTPVTNGVISSSGGCVYM